LNLESRGLTDQRLVPRASVQESCSIESVPASLKSGARRLSLEERILAAFGHSLE
jgi:hypothetical protein